jgi:probable HAF family extracellular repeat protein
VTALGALPGGNLSEAQGINGAGQIAGYSSVIGGAVHATLWNGTTPTDLGTLGGTNSGAQGINNLGQVVGQSYVTANTASHATLWSGTTVTDLGTLGGTNSYALSINDAGEIVGWSDTSNAGQHAVVWMGGQITDLNSLISPALALYVTLTEAFAINSNGQIAVDGTNAQTGQYDAFLLKPNAPVPLPAAAWLLLSGLTAFAALARSSKLRQPRAGAIGAGCIARDGAPFQGCKLLGGPLHAGVAPRPRI